MEARGIQTERLSEDQLVAIASPRHRLAKQRTVNAYTLAGEKLILGERGGNTRRLIDQFFAQAGVTLSGSMELSRQAAIRRMVEEDLGGRKPTRLMGLVLQALSDGDRRLCHARLLSALRYRRQCPLH